MARALRHRKFARAIQSVRKKVIIFLPVDQSELSFCLFFNKIMCSKWEECSLVYMESWSVLTTSTARAPRTREFSSAMEFGVLRAGHNSFLFLFLK
jgi:hypothetical protein